MTTLHSQPGRWILSLAKEAAFAKNVDQSPSVFRRRPLLRKMVLNRLGGRGDVLAGEPFGLGRLVCRDRFHDREMFFKDLISFAVAYNDISDELIPSALPNQSLILR